MKRDYLKSLVLRLCKQPRTFEFISRNVNGLEPTDTLTILNELESEGNIAFLNDLWVIPEVNISENLELYPTEKRHFLQKYMGYFDFLETPHPLDFEWRNSTESLNRLIFKIQDFTTVHDKILLLGMPTLFATAFQKDIANTVTLIERNAPIVRGLKKLVKGNPRFNVLEQDIFKIDSTIVGNHFCVIMDPPWYTPHFFQFMWLAAECVSIGGVVAISLPPINTRPNIKDERIEWFSFCKEIGLCIESLEPQTLQYAMPFFEFNALRAGGINDIMPFWRKGDLAVFRKVENSEYPRPTHEAFKNRWKEKEYKAVRIRVKVLNDFEENSTEELEIENILKMDILPTISSRDERRAEANIWTSGNRIFKTNRPKLFFNILEEIIYNEDLKEDSDDHKKVSLFIEMLAKLEGQEHKNYIDWIYYEMERQIT
jgi:hypothetical protein